MDEVLYPAEVAAQTGTAYASLHNGHRALAGDGSAYAKVVEAARKCISPDCEDDDLIALERALAALDGEK